MALVVCNDGERIALDALTTKSAGENLEVRLYSDNITPGEASVTASFTEVTAGNGYVKHTATPANWTTTEGDPSDTEYDEITWTFTGAEGNVYGYYVVQVTSGDLVWAELFTNGPYNIQNNGDQIKVTPKITLA